MNRKTQILGTDVPTAQPDPRSHKKSRGKPAFRALRLASRLGALAGVVAFGLGLSACGQKGPLTQPKPASATSQPQTPNTP
jgi:predicted small lipoprotein YifL